jgi:PAS domain S-box-containing protein
LTFQVTSTKDWRILLIDDDEDEYFLTKDKLSYTQGRIIELDWAPTYAAGLEMLKSKRYDAALIDYDLGPANGVDLIREATLQDTPTPLILYTSRGTFEADVEAMRAGAALYLSKEEANPLLLQRSIRYAIERKQAERQLRLVVNASPALMSYIGADFCYHWMNRNYEIWFGHQIDKVRGKHVREVLGEPAWNAVKPYMERALAGEVVEYLEELPYEGGGPRWVHVTYTPDRDEAGHVQGFVVHVVDVGERMRAVDAMKANEREFRAFFELSNAGKAVIDVETNRLVRVNRKFCELHGYSETELLSMRYQDLTYSEDREQSVKVYQDAINSGSEGWQIEKRCLRKDGQVIWEEVLGAIVRDESGRAVHNFVVVQDITERKLLEDRLAYLAFVLETVNDAVLATDVTQRITAWNKAAEELYGWTAEETMGRNPDEFLHTEITADQRIQALRQLAETGRTRLEVIQYTRDGRRLIVEGNTVAIRDSRGNVTGYVSSTKDITHQKQAEAAVVRYALELKRSNRELEEFALVASHDLNEPLRKIELFSQQLLATGDNLNNRQRDFLQRMNAGANRMRQMVDGLLELSRVNRQEGQFQEVDLAELTRETLSGLETQMESTGGRVEVFSVPNPAHSTIDNNMGPVVKADPLQIQRLLQNLVENALKFHQPGRPPSVKIWLVDVGDETVQIRVEDDGIGFDETQADALFQPFHRLVGRNEYEGTGMGLAICKKIVERHGGKISAQGRKGEGATFVITLPGDYSPA